MLWFRISHADAVFVCYILRDLRRYNDVYALIHHHKSFSSHRNMGLLIHCLPGWEIRPGKSNHFDYLWTGVHSQVILSIGFYNE